MLLRSASPPSLLRAPRAQQGGNYSVMMVSMLTVLMGFGALAMDVSLMRLAQSEAQDVADAAAHAAIVELKATGSATLSEEAAAEVIAVNTVVGGVPQIVDVEMGSWSDQSRTFTPGPVSNGVRVSVGRSGGNAVPLLMAPIFGWDHVNVTGSAVAATKSLQVILVIDITGSWHQKNFIKARQASVAFLDVLHGGHGDWDKVGMVLFLQRYGWEYTPFTLVESSANNPALVRNKWNLLNVGSYAGDYQATWTTGSNLNNKYVACKVYGTNNNGGSPWSGWCSSGGSCYLPTRKDKHSLSTPAGGCYTAMPRYFSDEGGTDHTTGMQMAKTMFQENIDPTAYKAMVVLTDGQPNGYTASTGSVRATQPYNETRFREYKRTTSHTTAQIETDTVTLANQMYNDLGVNTWFVSFVEYRAFMENAATGDGWFSLASSSADIVPIFEEIARSLPVSIVN